VTNGTLPSDCGTGVLATSCGARRSERLGRVVADNGGWFKAAWSRSGPHRLVLKKALNHPDRSRTGAAGRGRRPISKSRRRTRETAVARAWQARGPGFESPMLHPSSLNSKLAVSASECQFRASELIPCPGKGSWGYSMRHSMRLGQVSMKGQAQPLLQLAHAVVPLSDRVPATPFERNRGT
jgi:hypothetical protein